MPGGGSAEVLYLVDGSGILFRAFHALPPLTTRDGRPTGAAYGFTSMLAKLLRETGARRIAVVMDAPGRTFRDEAFAAYKASRAATPQDLLPQIPVVKELVDALGIPLLEIEGVEADDVIATLTERARAEGLEVEIVTSDKDLMQLVGPGVRLRDTMADRIVGPAEVEARFGVPPGQVVEVMALMGDAIDDIPGVKGIGEKTAARLIRHFGSVDEIYRRLDEVETLGLRGAKRIRRQLEEGREAARTSRFLATVRRDVPLDVEPRDLLRGEPDVSRLGELATSLEFGSVLREFLGGGGDPEERAARRTGSEEIERGLEREEPTALALATGPGGRGVGAVALARSSGAVAVAVALPPGLGAWLASDEERRAPLFVADAKALLHATGRDEGEGRLRPPAALVDTSLVSYVLDPGRRGHDVEALAAARLDRRLPPDDGTDPPARAAAAAAALIELGPGLLRELEAAGLDALYRDLELPVAAVLARIEARGIAVDRRVLEKAGREFEAKARALEEEIQALAGVRFNVHSSSQLRDVLFERLKLPTKGVRRGKTGLSVNAEVLSRLADEHPIAAKVLEHRALAKLLSTYVTGLLALIDPATGRLHTSFNQTVTATGRLSSSEPNLQNIPVRTAEGRRIRAAFVAPAGMLLVSADYSQIELRVLAHLTGDPVLVEAFSRGEDIHRRTAAEVFAVPPDAVTPELRRRAKVVNFGILYGMGPQRLARELGISTAEAERTIARYFERYASVRAFSERVVAQARADGYVTTLSGRRRPLPELHARAPQLRQAAERMAWNSPIQGSAADLIKRAMVAVEEDLQRQGLGARMLLQVHDELLLEVPAAAADEAGALVRSRMESVAELAVPLVVDVKKGPNWAAMD